MTDLVEQLRARAAELRGRAEFRDRYAYDQFCAELAVYDRSLADLIDGMLDERERLTQIPGRDFVTHMDNFVLPLVEFHVCSVIGEVTA